MMPSRKSPCYKCENRQYGCHALCGRYADFRRKLDSERQSEIVIKNFYGYVRSASRRMAMRRNTPDMRGEHK